MLHPNFGVNCLHERDVFGETPFYKACREGNIDVVCFLISNSYFNDKSKTLQSYIDEKADDGTTPFKIACYKGHVGVVKELLKYEDMISLCKTKIDDLSPEVKNEITQLINSHRQNRYNYYESLNMVVNDCY